MTTVSVQANKLLATRIHNIKRSFRRIRYGSVIQTNKDPHKTSNEFIISNRGHLYYQPKQWTVGGNLHYLDLPGHGLV